MTYSSFLSLILLCGFNPHTHEGCDINIALSVLARAVSIHTPTKGVTNSWTILAVAVYVSIHTPTKGVTHLPGSPEIPHRSFNPHTHEGCDQVFPVILTFSPCFNPHTHEGCDAQYAKCTHILSKFQSTHPRRV